LILSLINTVFQF